jgi:hypothetical protein
MQMILIVKILPLHCTLPLALSYSYKEYCRFTRCMNSLLACDLMIDQGLQNIN